MWPTARPLLPLQDRALYPTRIAGCGELGAATIANGANTDDLGDYRPGMQGGGRTSRPQPAGRMWSRQGRRQAVGPGVEAAGLGQAGHALPEQPCGLWRTGHAGAAGDDRCAEQFLRGLGLATLRVRYHKGDLARIEVPPEAIARLSQPETREKVLAELRRLGFQYVTLDLEGFRSGSQNRVLPAAAQLVELRTSIG